MPDRLGEPKLSEVVSAAAHLFRVDPDDLRCHDRHHPLVDYRAATMTACRMVTTASLPTIARYFDFRHHTTVMNVVRRAKADPKLRNDAYRVVEAVKAMIEAQP